MSARSTSAAAASDHPGTADPAAAAVEAGAAVEVEVEAGAEVEAEAGVEAQVAGQPSHRDRLIAAMAAAIEQQGYRETTVADVVRLARTSRRSFYEHFEDRDACFLALFDATNDAMMRRVAASVDFNATLDEQVDSAVAAYVASVTDQPVLFASLVRELPGLGASGAHRSAAAVERFARTLIALVDAAAQAQPGVVRRPLTIDTAIILVGGLRELLVFSVQGGRDLQELRANVGATAKAIMRGSLL